MSPAKNNKKKEKIEGEVVIYFPERGYGFIKYPGSIDDAFFHIYDIIGGENIAVYNGMSVEFSYDEAMNRALKINIVDKKIEHDFYQLAKLHKNNGNYFIAKKYFEQGIKDKPLPKLFDQYGLMEKDEGNIDAAEKIFKKGLTKYTDDPSLTINLALLLWETNRLSQAAEYFRKFLSIKKHESKVWFFLAQVLVGLGPKYHVEAWNCYEKSIKLEPENTKFKQNREILFYLMKDKEDIVKSTLLLFQNAKFSLEWLWKKLEVFVDIEIKTSDVVLRNSFEMKDRVLIRIVLDNTKIKEIVEDISKTLEKPISAPFRRINTNVAFLVCDDENFKKVYDYIKEIQITGLSIIPIGTAKIKSFLKGDAYENLLTHMSKFLIQNDLFDKRTPISDIRTFFGREDLLLDVTRKINRGAHIGIFGLRKIGKTSLLYRLAENFPTDLVSIADTEYMALKDCKYVFIDILKQIIKDATRKYPEILFSKDFKLINESVSELSTSEVAQLFKSHIEKLLETYQETKILVFIDEADLLVSHEEIDGFSGSLEFFRMIRGLSQTTERLFSIISCPNADICNLSKWDNQDNPIFQMYSENYLGNFSKSESKEMASKIGDNMAVTFNDDALNSIHNYSGGHPYITRQLCSVITQLYKSRPVQVTKEMVEKSTKLFFKKKIAIITEILDRIGEDSLQILRVISEKQVGIEEEILKSITKTNIKAHLYELEQYNLIEEKDGKYNIPIQLLNLWVRYNWVDSINE